MLTRHIVDLAFDLLCVTGFGFGLPIIATVAWVYVYRHWSKDGDNSEMIMYAAILTLFALGVAYVLWYKSLPSGDAR